jgi:hypothetical protein
VDDDPVLQVPPNGPRQNDALDVASDRSEVVDVLAVRDFVGAAVGVRARERRQERVVDVDQRRSDAKRQFMANGSATLRPKRSARRARSSPGCWTNRAGRASARPEVIRI